MCPFSRVPEQRGTAVGAPRAEAAEWGWPERRSGASETETETRCRSWQMCWVSLRAGGSRALRLRVWVLEAGGQGGQATDVTNDLCLAMLGGSGQGT